MRDWLAERHIRHRTSGTDDTDTSAVPTREADDGIDDIGASRDLEDSWLHGGFSVFGDNNRWFRLVFGARRSASGLSLNLHHGSNAVVIIGGGLVKSSAFGGRG